MTIWKYVFVAVVVHRAYSDRMPKRLMAVIAVLCVAHIQSLVHVIYVGFHTILNGTFFGKNMVYQKIQIVPIVLQRVAAAHAHSVKKLVFLTVKVPLNKKLSSLMLSFYCYRWTIRCCCSRIYERCQTEYSSASWILLNRITGFSHTFIRIHTQLIIYIIFQHMFVLRLVILPAFELISIISYSSK